MLPRWLLAIASCFGFAPLALKLLRTQHQMPLDAETREADGRTKAQERENIYRVHSRENRTPIDISGMSARK